MNKRFTTLMTTLILSVFFAISASAYDVEVDGIYYNINKQEKTAEVTTKGYFSSNYVGVVEIPENITVANETNVVISIGSGAFEHCDKLTKVVLPNTIQTIDSFAFSWCTNLEDIYIPMSLKYIREHAFEFCNKLSIFNIPKEVSVIDETAFYFCNLDSINVDDENKFFSDIDGVLFNKDASILLSFPSNRSGDYIIPNSVQEIGNYSFCQCRNIKKLTFSEGIKKIDKYAFVHSSRSFEIVDIPDLSKWINEVNIGCSPFYNSDLYIKGEIVSILDIPEGTKFINNITFNHCRSLTTVNFPKSAEVIGCGAFSNCCNLKTMNLNSIKKIGDEAFAYDDNIETVYYNSIDDWVNIEFGGFSSNPLRNGADLLINGNIVTEYAYPDTTKIIKKYIFAGYKRLSKVTLPEYLEVIGDAAFYGCEGLTSVNLPESIRNIGNLSFKNCKELTSVFIPNSVLSIGDEAFASCYKLSQLKLSESITEIGLNTFGDCRGLKMIEIPKSVKMIGEYAFCGCHGLSSINIPNSVLEIGHDAFYYCLGLENIYLPESVQTIGERVFYECNNIKNVYCYAKSVPNTGYNAFELSNANIATLYVPSLSLSAYKSTAPWSSFGTIKSIDSSDIKSIKARGIAIQSTGGFINISGLDNNEKVSFYAIDGKALGSAKSIDGNVSFSAKQGSVVVAKIGKESVKIAVE